MDGRHTTFCIYLAIIASIACYMVETINGLSQETLDALAVAEAVFVALFTVEYVARLWSAEDRVKYALSWHGVIDLVSILPFYMGLVVDLRAMRILRITRVFRVLKIARYRDAMSRFGDAVSSIKEDLVIFFAVTATILVICGIGIHYFEHEAQPDLFASAFHGVWWALTTLTTVGYGDMYPVTLGGRVFTSIILMLGLGVVSIPTGMLAASMMRQCGK